MAGKWLTILEAGQVLGISERTLRRHIKEGRIKSKVKDNRRLVLVSVTDDHVSDMTDHDQDHDSVKQSESQSELIQQLKSENENLRKQVDQQQAIIMQLSRNQQLMIESSEMKRKWVRGWFSRLFRKASDDKKG